MVDIVVKPVTRIDLAEQLDLGRIDMAVGTFSGIPQRFRSRFLFEYDDVLITGPKKDLGTLSTSKLAGLSLAVVSFGGERDGAIDGFISERGLARRSEMYDRSALDSALAGLERIPRIAFTLPHFLALPALVGNSDLAAIVPRPLAQAFLRSGSVSMHELPYPTARMEVRLLWHERHEADASQEWLREMLRKSTDQLRVTSPVTGSKTTIS
jgi:DNA-binding transcriptional LysR family regulator